MECGAYRRDAASLRRSLARRTREPGLRARMEAACGTVRPSAAYSRDLQSRRGCRWIDERADAAERRAPDSPRGCGNGGANARIRDIRGAPCLSRNGCLRGAAALGALAEAPDR